MPWKMIVELLGPGLQWQKTPDEILKAIEEANRRKRPDVAQHLRIILKRRNRVMGDKATS